MVDIQMKVLYPNDKQREKVFIVLNLREFAVVRANILL
ncbi:hypothetical protein RV18_GL002870 [Enterococcus termitis]|nr:hypothetical protein RV18_GL002870 [Enterococcus termitis]